MNTQTPVELLSNIDLVKACWHSFKQTTELLAALRARASKGKYKTEEDKKTLKGFYLHICNITKDLQLQYDMMSLLINQFDASEEAKVILETMKNHLEEYQELYVVLDDSLSHVV